MIPIKMAMPATFTPSTLVVIASAAVVTNVEVTMLLETFVCNAAHKTKMKTIIIGARLEIIGLRFVESQLVIPISILVMALPKARVVAHIIKLGQDTPSDITSLKLNSG